MFSYVLIAVGLAVVAASFFVSEKLDEKLGAKDTVPVKTHDVWTEKDEKQVSDRIEAILSEKSEEAVIHVDDQLSQISNEKIMAVSEFSDQILEKLEQNHSEVVFLYSMLGEKEEEIKKLVNQPVPVVAAPAPAVTKEKGYETLEEPETQVQSLKETVSGLEAASGRKKAPARKKEKPASNKGTARTIGVETMEGNQNDKILKLSEEGKSVLEISKELGLGQGEVKLVLDLFQGVGR